jgi:hypothetical protein
VQSSPSSNKEFEAMDEIVEVQQEEENFGMDGMIQLAMQLRS